MVTMEFWELGAINMMRSEKRMMMVMIMVMMMILVMVSGAASNYYDAGDDALCFRE